MALRCSLLGHSFGEATVEREREERGSEVVTAVREVERCRRCGAERVVSENKEVTSVVEPEEVGLADDGEVQGAGSFNDDEFEPPDSPAEEDAEIITDSGGEREPGEWPEEPGGDPTTTGTPGAVEEGDATDPADEEAGRVGDDHATVIEDDADEGTDPAQTSLEDATAPGSGADDAGAGAAPGGSESEPSPDRDPGESLTVPEGTLACPECDHEVDADSSFRAGDACPECQRGYLEQGE